MKFLPKNRSKTSFLYYSWPSFLLEQLERERTSTVEHKTRGSYKDDRLDERGTYFLLEEEEKKNL